MKGSDLLGLLALAIAVGWGCTSTGPSSSPPDAAAPRCGDGMCNPGEDCTTCAVDCGACTPSCGDGACNGSEDCASCEADCGACSSTGELGVTTVGSRTYTFTADEKHCNPITVGSSPIAVQRYELYTRAAAGSPKVRGALYDDVGGSPSTLIAGSVSDEATVTASAAWWSLPLPSAVSLDAGQTVWLCYVGQAGVVQYWEDVAGSSEVVTVPTSYASELTSTFSSPQSYPNTQNSMYLVYSSSTPTACGDGTCDASEDCSSCEADCGVCSETGLDFPGSAAVSTTMRFEFTDPQLHGLPIWGPGGQGVTYIWRAYPRQQAGYYTTFFWGNRGPFDAGGIYTYYGFHPYPQGDGTTHKWEIAGNTGGDFLGGAVAYDRWYTQVARVWADSAGKHHAFYWDWPDQTKVIEMTADPSYGNGDPPNPVLAWGDAPWPSGTGIYGPAGEGNEVYDGVLRGIQIYSTALSLTEISSEIDTPLSTTTGRSTIWYLNLDPTPTDISDKSGRGHDPAWVGTERPALYSN